MMMGGVRTGTRVRPTTTLGLPGYQGRQSGAGNKEITLGSGGLKKKKKGPGKSKADSLSTLLDVRGDIRSPAVVRKKSQEVGGRSGSGLRSGQGGGRSGQGGGRGGVIGSSVTLSRQAPGSSGVTGGSGKGTGTSLEVGQDCGFSGTRVCSGHSKK